MKFRWIQYNTIRLTPFKVCNFMCNKLFTSRRTSNDFAQFLFFWILFAVKAKDFVCNVLVEFYLSIKIDNIVTDDDDHPRWYRHFHHRNDRVGIQRTQSNSKLVRVRKDFGSVHACHASMHIVCNWTFHSWSNSCRHAKSTKGETNQI